MVTGEITAFVTSVRAAYDIAKGIGSLKVEVERNQAVSKILEILLSVQSDALSMQTKYQELLQSKDDLSKKLMEYEKWSETESQYELKEINPDVFVRSYKTSNQSQQPNHWLCTKCWEDKKKAILQKHHTGAYECQRCGSKIYSESSRGGTIGSIPIIG